MSAILQLTAAISGEYGPHDLLLHLLFFTLLAIYVLNNDITAQ
jgi:hypothetical protein